MKTVRYSIVALFLTVAASAQPCASSAQDGSSPAVYMISVQETDTLVPGEWRARAARNRMAMLDAVDDYDRTHRTGFQQCGRPQFLFAHKQNKYSLAVGGFIALRTSYDFDGTPSAADFIPSSIPIPGDYASQQRLSMDASTSRIYLKGIANTRALGRVVVYVATDFRGGAQGSYTPRLREAYVSFKGFTFGRDVTTFCDLDAGPAMIDFQGPNAYNFAFATMIRYEVPFANDHLKFGLAAELPGVSGTFGDTFDSIPQRVPDFPIYFQYAWGAERDNHLRLTGVVRDLYLHDATAGNNTSLLGWGVQASARINLAPVLTLYGNGVYGEGITRYIQDLSGRVTTSRPIRRIRPRCRPCRCGAGTVRRASTSCRSGFSCRAAIPKRASSRNTAISRATSIAADSISSETSSITSRRVAASPPNTCTAGAKTGTG